MVGGNWALYDPRIAEYVRVLLVSDDTGHEQQINLDKELNFQWIPPQQLHSAHDIVIVLSPLPFDLPAMEIQLQLFFSKGSKITQLDCGSRNTYMGNYIPNRNGILIRDRIVLPKGIQHLSIHLEAASEQVSQETVLKLIDLTSYPDDYSIQGSDKVLASSTNGHLHWSPCQEGAELIFEATLVSKPEAELPYWDAEQIPSDPLMLRPSESNRSSDHFSFQWNLITHSGATGLALQRDTTWEDKLEGLRKSWESKEKGRLEQGLVTRAVFNALDPGELGLALSRKKQDDESEERKRRAQEIGQVDKDPFLDLSCVPEARIEGSLVPADKEEAGSLEEIAEMESAQLRKLDYLLQPLAYFAPETNQTEAEVEA